MNLTIKNISKTYANGVKALNNVSLSIPKGMYGLLGSNGAGKSSLMRSIATLQEVDEGSISFDDVDVLKNKQEVRKILGYLPQEFGLYPEMKAYDLLQHIAVLKGISNKKECKERVERLLLQTNLWDHRKKQVGNFSGGMRQRFGIAQALIGDPKLIIVDEPTAGLDPEERNRFYHLLSEIGENVVVILSTHIVEDVKELCTNMAIINKGTVLLECEPLKILQSLEGRIWRKLIEKDQLQNYENEFNVISSKLFTGKTLIHIYGEERPDDSFKPVNPDLEDVYFKTIKDSRNSLS